MLSSLLLSNKPSNFPSKKWNLNLDSLTLFVSYSLVFLWIEYLSIISIAIITYRISWILGVNTLFLSLIIYNTNKNALFRRFNYFYFKSIGFIIRYFWVKDILNPITIRTFKNYLIILYFKFAYSSLRKLKNPFIFIFYSWFYHRLFLLTFLGI
jgi:hypothetical protein